jgi:phosphatidylserine/phosphatidylglycerophosphate/cardiolipin synthase-like enzyme
MSTRALGDFPSGTPATSVPDRLVSGGDQRRAAVIDLIRGARRTIALSLFRCNDKAIFEELAAATARGVVVDVLVTSRAKGGKKKLEKLWRALADTGASLHAYNDPVVKYHAKYIVADDGPSIVASLNFTRKCFRKTWDALVVTHDPAVASGLKQLMAADRDAMPMPADLSPRLILGPERARAQFTSLIMSAQRSIRLIDAKVSDPDLIDLLKRRRAEGVAIEIYGAKRIGDLKSHGKIMLVDESTAIVGSLALAALSLDFRREVAIAVTDPPAVVEAVQLFAVVDAARRASEAAAPDAGSEAQC